MFVILRYFSLAVKAADIGSEMTFGYESKLFISEIFKSETRFKKKWLHFSDNLHHLHQ